MPSFYAHHEFHPLTTQRTLIFSFSAALIFFSFMNLVLICSIGTSARTSTGEEKERMKTEIMHIHVRFLKIVDTLNRQMGIGGTGQFPLCSFSAPLVQKNSYLSPICSVMGQSGHIQPISSVMHDGLPPKAQYSNSLFPLAQSLYDGQSPQMQSSFLVSTICILSSSVSSAICCMICSNLSIIVPPT